MQYFLFEEQDGGCGYTIDCGKRLREITGACSMEDAMMMACAQKFNRFGDEDGTMMSTEGDCSTDRASVFAVAEIKEVNMTKLAADRDAAKRQQKQDEKDAADRVEWERLNKKFGGA